MRNARSEAFAKLNGRYEVRVLEPSPPTVDEGPWFADDPAARGLVPPQRELVSPVTKADLLWDDLAANDPVLAEWCAARWLGNYPPLPAVPPTLVQTREELHRLAEHVVSPARAAANGKIGLRYTFCGFGTPFFSKDRQVRVEDMRLVLESGKDQNRAPLGSLAEAAAFVGVELGKDAETPVEPRDEPLQVDPAAAALIADWYGFVTSVLEQLRAEAGPELEASRVQLWPEHFDISAEFGSETDGERAGFGGSPGDALHPEPYLYVVPWDPEKAVGESWNSVGFKGAELSYAELLAAPDQREFALRFFWSRLRELVGA
jgi:hypothetical protein